jgi:hypothetical protein
MTTRAQIDEAVARYAGVPRQHLPQEYRNPSSAHYFDISMALLIATLPRFKNAGPVYDDNDNLIGWHGVRMADR